MDDFHLGLYAFCLCLAVFNVGRWGTAMITAAVDWLWSKRRG